MAVLILQGVSDARRVVARISRIDEALIQHEKEHPKLNDSYHWQRH